MEKLELEALADRVERLEQENQWLKRLGVLTLVGLAALAIFGTNLIGPARQVEAERFVVKDQHGQVRASLGILPDGQPALKIQDELGRDQVALRALTERSSSLEFTDGGKLRAALSSSSSGAANLNLFARDNGIATGLYVWPDNEAGLAINRGLSSLVFGVKPDGTAQALISDAEGNQYGGPIVDVEGGRLSRLAPSSPAMCLPPSPPFP